jgi:hypothetical protein
VLLEMVSGERPWKGKGSQQIWALVAMKRRAPPIPADVPPPIADIRPGPPAPGGRLSALSVFLCKIGFLWGFCMGAQGA